MQQYQNDYKYRMWAKENIQGADAAMSEDYPGQFDVVYRKYYHFDSHSTDTIFFNNYMSYRRNKSSDKVKNLFAGLVVGSSNAIVDSIVPPGTVSTTPNTLV